MTSPVSSDPAAELRVTRLIVGAFTAGVVSFAAVAAAVAPVGEPLPKMEIGLDMVSLAAIAVTFFGMSGAFVIPPRIVEGARRGEPQRRMQAFRASRILAGALLEGPALLWCIALLLSGNRWLLVPIAVLVGLLAIQLPTRDAFESATGQRVRGA